jgi:hypothetical protein
MALLVCFREAGCPVDWSKKAIYLDQGFYELLFKYYKRRRTESPLKGMIAIGYDDEFSMDGSQIEAASVELERITMEGEIVHPQAKLLISVFRDAALRRCELLVAGDMYPDLSRR